MLNNTNTESRKQITPVNDDFWENFFDPANDPSKFVVQKCLKEQQLCKLRQLNKRKSLEMREKEVNVMSDLVNQNTKLVSFIVQSKNN